MDIGVFHPGTQHSWQTALALQDMGRLAWYATSIFYQPDRFPYYLERWLPRPLGQRLESEFRRFQKPELDPRLVRTSGVFEWLERLARRTGLRGMASQLDRIGNHRFGSMVVKSIEPGTALWGFDGCSRKAFEAARRKGIRCILDRTIGDLRAYNLAMEVVQARYSEWFTPQTRSVPDWKIEEGEREYALADHILVGSEFAANTVRHHSNDPSVAEKIRVLPYCFDESRFAGLAPPSPVDRSAPVRFLFLGQVNVRKGIHHVLEAIACLPASQAQLTIVGDMQIPHDTFARYADRVSYRRTVPRSDVATIMAEHHVLLFPSYFEGSALSLIEGLASGMAVIQTHQAGNGTTSETGMMLPEPSTETVLAAMLRAIEDRDLLDTWRAAAPIEAEKYSFTRYRQNIGQFLRAIGTDQPHLQAAT